jgi:hypothetical protein
VAAGKLTSPSFKLFLTKEDERRKYQPIKATR